MMQRLYLSFVLIGFFIFLLIPVISYHTLTPNIVHEAIGNEDLAKKAENRLRPIMGQRVNTLLLQTKLGEVYEAVNTDIIKKNSLSDAHLTGLKELMAKNQLNEESLELIFDESSEFQRGAFTKYGGWLFNREFASKEAASKALNEVNSNIIAYEILPRFGLDKYKQKSIRYTLSKLSIAGIVISYKWLFIALAFGLASLGALGLSLNYLNIFPANKNNGIMTHPATSRKWLAIIIGSFLILFYIVLYFYPEFMTSWIALVDPSSLLISGNPAGQFFLYGLLYTLCVLVMGVRMLIKHRDNRYQMIRTGSVIFFQLIFAFLIPEILVRLNKPYFDFKNIWPLDYDFFFDFELEKLLANGQLGIFMLVWGIALTAIAVPVFTYFYGKRWYCSWVCGCGGLAETLGDPFRHLSDKRLKAWYFEQVSIYSVLAFAVIMTGGVLYTYFTGSATVLGVNTFTVREVYGGLIGAGFAGVVGTGFYPFMGNRVWCRFGCPLAAYIGIIQRFKSRFRITTNGGQCISCGNCSTYCEMGIDVRSYAQKGENIVRASCVGCGVCADVCPRGVLKLENGPSGNRFTPNGFIK